MFICSNVVLILLAIFFYNGSFSFWQYPFSELGTLTSMAHLDNTVASRIFSLDMIVNFIIFLSLSRLFGSKINKTICMVGGLGFLVGGFSPDDIMHSSHVLGMSLGVASLWLIDNSLIIEKKPQLSSKNFLSLLFLANIPIFVYAGTFFANVDPLAYIFQKITLFSIVFVLLAVTARPKSSR
jgi:hypothetical protein